MKAVRYVDRYGYVPINLSGTLIGTGTYLSTYQVRASSLTVEKISSVDFKRRVMRVLQCFDAVGRTTKRTSGL